MNLHVVNRGRASLRVLPAEATVLTADVRDREATRAALLRRGEGMQIPMLPD